LLLLRGLAARPLDLVKLQVGADRHAADGAGAIWADALDPDGDFLALAEQMQGLDLVICVDTAGAHLAGALGRPTWMLLPWASASRWQRHSQETLWYPGMRLWRQPVHGDWRALWPRLLAELDCWLNRWNTAL
jgi:ADP-heptose:LPS heptosyltransferase